MKCALHRCEWDIVSVRESRALPSSTNRNVEKGRSDEELNLLGRREKTPTPKTRFSIWTLLRTPGRFTTRPLPVHFTTKMSVVRPFSVLSKDEIGPHNKTGRFLSKAEILGVGVFSPLSIFIVFITFTSSLHRLHRLHLSQKP